MTIKKNTTVALNEMGKTYYGFVKRVNKADKERNSFLRNNPAYFVGVSELFISIEREAIKKDTEGQPILSKKTGNPILCKKTRDEMLTNSPFGDLSFYATERSLRNEPTAFRKANNIDIPQMMLDNPDSDFITIHGLLQADDKRRNAEMKKAQREADKLCTLTDEENAEVEAEVEAEMKAEENQKKDLLLQHIAKMRSQTAYGTLEIVELKEDISKMIELIYAENGITKSAIKKYNEGQKMLKSA
mgnify:CR=1 FL=1